MQPRVAPGGRQGLLAEPTELERAGPSNRILVLEAEQPTLLTPYRIGEFWNYPQSRPFAELLIDCEEDRTLRAVLDEEYVRALTSFLAA